MCSRQIVTGGAPNVPNTLTAEQQQGGGTHDQERHQHRVFDYVLSALLSDEAGQKVSHGKSPETGAIRNNDNTFAADIQEN
jgi:hypothetical protein